MCYKQFYVSESACIEMLSVILIFVFVIALIVLWYIKYFKFQKYISKYKGPTPLPILGSILSIKSSSGTFSALRKFHKEYGRVFQLWIATRPRLPISDYKFVEYVLGSTVILDKGQDYKFLHSWLGNGLLTSTGSRWKRQRKLITPAFHFQILEQFVPIFNTQSNILKDRLLMEVDAGPFDIFPYISLCALDVICEAAMGTQVKAQERRESKYVYSVKQMCEIVSRRFFSPVKAIDALYWFTGDYLEEKECLGVLHGHTESVIRSRKKDILASVKKTEKLEDDIGAKKRHALLDLLLQCQVDGEPLTDQEIRQEVDTFMFEGHDTTTSGISFTLYCLSRNLDVQERAVQELRDIMGNSRTSFPSYQNLQEMKYLEMVIKESLRLYPPVPFFGRVLTQNQEYDGATLPKGLTLLINVTELHMQAETFPDPERFDPERFSIQNSAQRSPYAYIPFSAGPRNCIGQRFAILEMKSTISTILRNFEVLPVPEHSPQLIPETILKSANGLLVKLAQRSI